VTIAGAILLIVALELQTRVIEEPLPVRDPWRAIRRLFIPGRSLPPSNRARAPEQPVAPNLSGFPVRLKHVSLAYRRCVTCQTQTPAE
jgi:hypothetical protein